MRPIRRSFAGLLCLLGACVGDAKSDDKGVAPRAQLSYAECMTAANGQASRPQSVVAAEECMGLPDAPAADSTLPAFVSPDSGAAADSGAIHSVYTSLEQGCRVMELDEEAGGSIERCPGTAGYALLVSEGDVRMSVGVITPDGKAHELHYWSVITQGFSSLGPRAEWRMRGGRPVALIVRVNASENPEDASQLTSYLAVAKITPQEICVTDRIDPVPDANTLARAAADRSAGRTCLSHVSER